MPAMGRLRRLEWTTARYHSVPVIMASATKSRSVVQRSRELEAAGYIIKPHQMSEVRR